MIKRLSALAITAVMLIAFTSCGCENEIVAHSISIADELVNSGNPGAAKIAITETLEKYPNNQELADYLAKLGSAIDDIPVPTDSEALQKFYDAYSLYIKWFVMGMDKVCHNKVKTKEIDNIEYYEVTESGFSSVTDINDAFLKYYSSDYLSDLTSYSSISYEETDGKLFLKYNKNEGLQIKTIDELSIKETKINDDNFEITYQVLYDNGKSGIANGSTHLVRTLDGYVLDSESITDITCPIEVGQYTVNIETELTELRDLPHNNGEVIASIENGAEVNVCSGNDTWAYVETEDLSGWICISYLTKGSSEDEENNSPGDVVGDLVDSGLDFIRQFLY